MYSAHILAAFETVLLNYKLRIKRDACGARNILDNMNI